MKVITRTSDLALFCTEAAGHPYVTVDTEFLRERTYYAQLCLIQLAQPGDTDEGAVLVDVLAEDLDLAPLYELFRDTSTVKVFHAARQDLEIFCVDGGVIPEPLFDTQIAAMVCGYGEQVGYETLVRAICKQGLDKSSRFTDWSRRPLSDKQMRYALGDVTHLRQIYEALAAELASSGRADWVSEEMAILSDPATYEIRPEEAWRRVKTRSQAPRFLAVVRELARYREEEAQRRNQPRGRIFKDDVITEVAATRPRTLDDLAKSRLLTREARRGEIAEAILASVARAMALDEADLPAVQAQKRRKPTSESLLDLLRVLLKARAEETGVAQRLIASAADLEDLAAAESDDLAVLRGWRGRVFGADAIRLREGRIALSAADRTVRIVDLEPVEPG
ncbi:MAG: ribonuclease D [Pseudomonadota bacterium]